MWLLGLCLLAAGLKFAEIGPFAELSWWYIVGGFIACFLWFEYGEKLLGLDKKSEEHDELERLKKERIAKMYDVKGKGKK